VAQRKVKAKKKCCGSDPRCKRCPVVLKRLDRAGFAERVGRRSYIIEVVPKKRMKKVRAR
jgi:hypothetical protein